jgi:hypothetical protein
MSTRATYKIEDHKNNAKIYFYIHHDGYPAGAARYFNNMLESYKTDTSRSYATHFLLANKNAEFTVHHDWHSDIDYCYNIWICQNKQCQIIAYEEVDGGKQIMYDGKLEDFIKFYHYENQDNNLELARISQIVQTLAKDIEKLSKGVK